MKNYTKRKTIYKTTEQLLSNSNINDNNLDIYLDKYKINKKVFLFTFPKKKLASLSTFYFEKSYLITIKKSKTRILKEKSISKKTKLMVLEFLKNFFNNINLSIFFLNYTFLNLFYFLNYL